ncbi:MAG: universal stress protein, partial [Acidobacteriota bacterium]
TDGSSFGDASVQEAIRYQWPPDSEFRVLTVMEHFPISYLTMDIYYPPVPAKVIEEARQVAEKIAANAATLLQEHGLKVTHIVRQGQIAEEIIDEANQWGADLILIGTHSRHGLSKFLLGSIAQRVASHASCSVEIVRQASY